MEIIELIRKIFVKKITSVVVLSHSDNDDIDKKEFNLKLNLCTLSNSPRR